MPWLIAWQTWQNIVILFDIFGPLFPNAFFKTDFLRSFFFGLQALLGALQLGQYRFLNFRHGPESGTNTTSVDVPFVFVQRISLQPLVPFLVSELLPFLFPFLFKRYFLSGSLPFIIRRHWSTNNQSRTTAPMVKFL